MKNLCRIMSCYKMPTVLISLGSARTPQKRMRVNQVYCHKLEIDLK